MRTLILTLVLCLVMPACRSEAVEPRLGVMEAPVGGTTVRGRLIRIARDGRQYPAPGIMVRLYSPQMGPSAPSYSDNTGMYYLMNVPPGLYTLEVWLNREDVRRYNVVARPQQYSDVPPIAVP